MKKIFYTILISALLITGCSHSSSNNVSDNTNDTEVNATEYETSTDNTEYEAASALSEGVAYQFKDGTCVSIDELLAPMVNLNNICQGVSDSNAFSMVYPEDVINKLLEYNGFDNISTYADFFYTTYVQIYGDNFSLSNEYVKCSILDDEQLSDMTDFYKEYFYTDIEPAYAFIVESEFCVTYTDEEGNEQGDYLSDYYIAYSLNGNIYLDYFYVDSLDL